MFEVCFGVFYFFNYGVVKVRLDLIKILHRLNNRVTFIRVQIDTFLNLHKAKIAQFASNGISLLVFVLGYVKKRQPPTAVPLFRFFNYRVF